MKAEPFVRARRAEWHRFEVLIEALTSRSRAEEHVAARESIDEFPELHRRVCRDLALARHRDFDPQLVERLNGLALAGHRLLHRDRSSLWSATVQFLSAGFPIAVRRERQLVWWAHLCFWGPFLALLVVGRTSPEWIVAFLGGDMTGQLGEMYDPSNETMGVPPDETRFRMFGFYIFNNVGIAFRTFAGGVLFGVGSVFFLVFNGFYIGAVVAYLIHVGFSETFLPFAIGHGSLELTGICLSGAAGMKLGGALIRPGRRSRKRALVEEGRRAVTLLYGATAFLFGAALVEAFWSPSAVPNSVKYGVGALGWLAVIVYLTFVGRGREELVE